MNKFRGATRNFFMGMEALGTAYARYYSYIISVIDNTLTSVTKTNHYITFMIEILICLFRYIFT